MNKIIHWLWAVLISACLSGSAMASGVGTTGADILNIPLGARAIGMGEAYTAMADDVSSLYWNPGGLALMQERQASFSYNKLVQDESYQDLAIGIPLENGAIGGSLSYLSYGQISGYDQNGAAIGNQSAYSGVGTLGASWLGNLWSLGFNVKGVRESLADTSANTAAFDVGGTAIYPHPVLGGTMRMGFVVQNLGPGITLINQTDPLPTEWKVGLAAVQLMDKKLDLALDLGKPRDAGYTASGGAEYWLWQYVALRAGYVSNNVTGSGIRTGVGLRVKNFDFNYAYAGEGELGITNRFEVSFRFGEPRPILTPEQYKIMKQANAAMRQGNYDQAVLLYNSVIETAPQYKKARRMIKVAMANMEQQQNELASKQGTNYQPTAQNIPAKQGSSDLDDLEQLLSIPTSKAAKAPATNNNGGDTTSAPSNSQTEVK